MEKRFIEQWQALYTSQRTLLCEHHDFYLVCHHPLASAALHGPVRKYEMPARLWEHGLNGSLEILCSQLTKPRPAAPAPAATPPLALRCFMNRTLTVPQIIMAGSHNPGAPNCHTSPSWSSLGGHSPDKAVLSILTSSSKCSASWCCLIGINLS
jgi:hypothetical protein